MVKCAIIGTGKIGIDLYVKCKISKFVNNVEIYNQNPNSIGHIYCKKNNFNVFDTGITGIKKKIEYFDIIIDATSSSSNKENYRQIKKYIKKDKFFLNMTPSGIGNLYIPFFYNGDAIPNSLNLISCGGQSTIPIILSIKNYLKNSIKNVEVVSSISSKSAGPATRSNVNDYILSTNNSIKYFSNIKKIKIIISKINNKIKRYIPGYNAIYFKDLIKDNIFRVTTRVVGAGHYLPSYAGNLDIINSSAIEIIRLVDEKKNTHN